MKTNLRYSSVFGESIRYVWAHDQGNHFVKNRFPEYVSENETNENGQEETSIQPETLQPTAATLQDFKDVEGEHNLYHIRGGAYLVGKRL